MRVRPTARLLVLDDQQRLLLFHIHDGQPIHADFPDMAVYWLTPGGGIDAGETAEEAARRELWEEAGIRVGDVGPCVWRFDRLVHARSGDMLIQDAFFLVRVPASVVSTANMLDYEHETHRDHRWWTLDELAASREVFLPPRLPDLLPPLARGEIPPAPLVLTAR